MRRVSSEVEGEDTVRQVVERVAEGGGRQPQVRRSSSCQQDYRLTGKYKIVKNISERAAEELLVNTDSKREKIKSVRKES